MEIVNNKIENPLKHYREQFAAADPERCSAKSTLPYQNGVFTVPFLNRTAYIRWPEMTGTYDNGEPVGDTILILLARLIMNGALVPSQGKLLSYPEMPWGDTYAVQFRGRCMQRLAGTYGRNPEKFAACMESIGGRKTTGGDIAYDLDIVPELSIRVILWAPDEEFPANAQVLFTDNFPFAFTAEDIAIVGDTFQNAMKGRW